MTGNPAKVGVKTWQQAGWAQCDNPPPRGYHPAGRGTATGTHRGAIRSTHRPDRALPLEQGAVRGGDIHDAIGQRPDPTPRFCRVVTNVDQVAQVSAESINLQTIKVSPGRRSFRHSFHCGRSDLSRSRYRCRSSDRALGSQRVQLEVGVLVRRAYARVGDLVCHGRTYRNSCGAGCCVMLFSWRVL